MKINRFLYAFTITMLLFSCKPQYQTDLEKIPGRYYRNASPEEVEKIIVSKVNDKLFKVTVIKGNGETLAQFNSIPLENWVGDNYNGYNFKSDNSTRPEWRVSFITKTPLCHFNSDKHSEYLMGHFLTHERNVKINDPSKK